MINELTLTGTPFMTMSALFELLGDGAVLAIGGGLSGLAFGALAQHSQFCMRAATIEVARGEWGQRLAVWVLGFGTAVALTQAVILAGIFDPGAARQIALPGSLSGAIIGGLLFGVGMILSRGCASRLVVLAATGNVRALVTVVVMALVAIATIRGVLVPAREMITTLWPIEPGPARNWLTSLGLPPSATPVIGILIGSVWLAFGVILARRTGVGVSTAVAGALIGVAIVAAWLLTYALSFQLFEPVQITSISFIAPSVETVSALTTTWKLPSTFDGGLIPGVAVGSFVMALITRQLKLQVFDSWSSVLRYLSGAVLMGFGGVLAIGCSVGAGLTGGSIFALTAWVSLIAMWVSAMLTDRLVDQTVRSHMPAPVAVSAC